MPVNSTLDRVIFNPARFAIDQEVTEMRGDKGIVRQSAGRGAIAGTTIKIKPRREEILIGKGLEGIFDLVFYRKPSIGIVAAKFVEYVISRQKSGNPMNFSEWQDWIKKNQVSQKQFYNITNKLTGIGMIRKEEGVYISSSDFSRTLNMMADIWDARRTYLQSEATGLKAES